MNRIANVYDFWGVPSETEALNCYSDEKRSTKALKQVDKDFAKTLGRGLAEPGRYKAIRDNTAGQLARHVNIFEQVKEHWKRLKSGSG